MSTIEAYNQRLVYDEVLPVDFFNQNFIDYNSLNRYGIVDTQNNLIIPRYEKLKPFKNSKGKQLLSFVSRAYEGMLKDFQQQVATGQWEKNSLFRDLPVAQAFVSPLEAFDKFMTSQFRQLMPSPDKVKQQLLSIYKNRDIVDFVSFVKVFEQYVVSVNYDFPYTLVGFLEQQNNVAFSGLQIELSGVNKNNFDQKMELIQDPAFNRYVVLAQRHGFLVNRNMPWILIADIDSTPMQKYASIDAGIIIGTTGILQRYFHRATDLSYNFFTKYLIGSYNSIATSEPQFSYAQFDKDACNGFKRIVIKRKAVRDFGAQATDNKALLQLLYFTLRYYECFADRDRYKGALRRYYSTQKLKKYPFAVLVEKIVSPVKNSKMVFYQITGTTIPTSFEFSFQAEEAAAKLGSSGAHQMPNGRWMPCKTHDEYISLTNP
jgi:hypothetical protein